MSDCSELNDQRQMIDIDIEMESVVDLLECNAMQCNAVMNSHANTVDDNFHNVGD